MNCGRIDLLPGAAFGPKKNLTPKVFAQLPTSASMLVHAPLIGLDDDLQTVVSPDSEASFARGTGRDHEVRSTTVPSDATP